MGIPPRTKGIPARWVHLPDPAVGFINNVSPFNDKGVSVGEMPMQYDLFIRIELNDEVDEILFLIHKEDRSHHMFDAPEFMPLNIPIVETVRGHGGSGSCHNIFSSRLELCCRSTFYGSLFPEIQLFSLNVACSALRYSAACCSMTVPLKKS